jgi:hypothetical protein
MIDFDKLDDFTRAYIECALWSTNDESTPSGGVPLDDNYGPSDIAEDTLALMVKECEEFQREYATALGAAFADQHLRYDASNAGHDFWLTRNGHGAGFWDRGLGEIGDALSDACERFGECWLFVGDDGEIHQS